MHREMLWVHALIHRDGKGHWPRQSHGVCRHIPRTFFAALALLGCSTLPPVTQRPALRTELWGFTAPWDPRSTGSVAANQTRLDAVISGWIALDSVTFRPVQLFPDSFVTGAVPGTARTRPPRAMALVTSYHGTRFHPETIRALTADAGALAGIAQAIAAMVSSAGYHGIILDLEGMTQADLPALLAFTTAVADSAHARGVTPVALAVPAPDTAAYPARPLLRSLDALVVMLYDQHWRTSPPGPIASPDWVRAMLAIRTGEVGAERLVAAFPVYGYQWWRDSTAATVVSYNDARRLAAEAHVPLERDSTSRMLHARTDAWTVWVSDAILVDQLMHDARTAGVTRFALWRLGVEDPAIWTHMRRSPLTR